MSAILAASVNTTSQTINDFYGMIRRIGSIFTSMVHLRLSLMVSYSYDEEEHEICWFGTVTNNLWFLRQAWTWNLPVWHIRNAWFCLYLLLNLDFQWIIDYCPGGQSPRGDCKAGNIGNSIHEIFSSVWWWKFNILSNSFICKNERNEFNGAKFKIKVDLKEKITQRYLGEVYQGICRCVEWRNIRASVGILMVLLILYGLNTWGQDQSIRGYQVWWGPEDSDWREVMNTLRYYARLLQIYV